MALCVCFIFLGLFSVKKKIFENVKNGEIIIYILKELVGTNPC